MHHTCAAWLVRSTVPLPEVHDLLRHTTLTMTEKYAHLAPDNAPAAVAILDGSASHFWSHPYFAISAAPVET